MSDGPWPLQGEAQQSALGHFAAWAEHMMQGLAALGTMHPMGMPPAIATYLAGARARLDAAKAALEDGARAVTDAESGNLPAAEADVGSAGAELGSAFQGDQNDVPAAGEVVSGGAAVADPAVSAGQAMQG